MAGRALDQYDDESLVALIKQQDHRAFSILVNRHTDRFYGLAWRMTANNQEAEDIVQEAFLKLWQNPALYNPRKNAKFVTWFYRVVTNISIDRLRRNKKTVGVDHFDYVADDRAGQDENMEADERQEYLERAIQDLPDKQKTALNLCFYEGLSNKEAADIMGVKIKALESLLMRAKAGIKDRLIRQGLREV
ncbi:MAG: sigma-70 family RNA polymerase sigma factor [Rhodospirillales bacterium]|nr:sigma-70 family RNA polymerase sigma factor [Rhodospirillales bacterium]